MKDVEYALFAQVTYYNWFNYRKKESDLSAIFKDIILMEILLKGKSEDFISQNTEIDGVLSNGDSYKIYRGEDKRLLMMYSEDTIDPDKNKKYKNLFEGWELIEGTNHEKIYGECERIPIEKLVIKGVKEKEGYGAGELIREDEKIEFNRIGISELDSGFQGVVFKKGNKVIISLRGTDFSPITDGFDGEKEFHKDMVDTNSSIFFNNIPDQVRCSIYFYEKIKSKYPNCEIHVTGHSLGGALAQFVALYGGENIKKTITWNGLGVRNISEEMLLGKVSQVILDRIDKLDIRKKDLELIEEFNLNEHKEIYQNPFELLLEMKIKKQVKENYEKLEDKLINYYLSKDIIKSLSNKTGKNICVDNPEESTKFGSVIRTVELAIGDGKLSLHGINNFLPFFNEEGNIVEDKLNKEYFQNYIKTLLVKNLDLKEKINVFREVKESGKVYPKAYIYDVQETRAKVITELLLTKNRKKLNFLMLNSANELLLSEEAREEILLNEKPFVSEGDEIVFGKFANYDILAGVMGGEEIRLDLIDILKNQHPDGRKIDYISEALLKNEFGNNGLNFMVKEGGYNFFSSVVETIHTKDLKIFDLGEKALNQDDNIRVYLEEAIENAIPQGEVKANYKAKENWIPSDKGTIEKLYEQAKKKKSRFGGSSVEVNTPKSEKFYKSFLEEMVDEKSVREENQADIDERNRLSRLKEKKMTKMEEFIGGTKIENRGNGFQEYARTKNNN